MDARVRAKKFLIDVLRRMYWKHGDYITDPTLHDALDTAIHHGFKAGASLLTYPKTSKTEEMLS